MASGTRASALVRCEDQDPRTEKRRYHADPNGIRVFFRESSPASRTKHPTESIETLWYIISLSLVQPGTLCELDCCFDHDWKRRRVGLLLYPGRGWGVSGEPQRFQCQLLCPVLLCGFVGGRVYVV